MYLKRLDIQGFKSFANKISLEFDKGITSVVGPNGSGKSNIADAIRWVLGEQSAKTLRGSRMEDIIFSGTEHRKPIGFAEVSLTIDNSDGELPVEYSEVTITRRVFRSGESEYLINKTSCRLKDITQLFFDTGIGKDGYSIIGQGRVDEILSSRSEDRRHIFEEASGIMKYKVRKGETEKKLEMTKQNLIRINDIITELENQLEPLKHQSEAAKKYLSLRESLKELEVNVFIENISRYKEKISEFDKKYSLAKENINSENKELERVIADSKKKNEMVRTFDDRLDKSRQEYYSLESILEKCNSEIQLNNEKISNLEKNIERLDNEITETTERSKSFDVEVSQKRDDLKFQEKKYEDCHSKLELSEKEMQEMVSTLDEGERLLESLKTGVLDKNDILLDKKVQLNNVKTHIDGIKKRQDSIEQEIIQNSSEVRREQEKKEELVNSIDKAVSSINEIKTEIETLSKRKAEMCNELEKKRKYQNKLKSDIQFNMSRYKMLSEMQQNFEGYNRSVKEVLKACSESSAFGKGIHGALAQLIEVDRKYETAIEMSLGGNIQNIVTDSEGDGKKAIEFLKKHRLGRATFLPVSSIRGRDLETDIINAAKNQPGFVGQASELVKCNNEYKDIVSSYLGRVVIVDDLDAAIKMAKNFKYRFRIVTLEGDVLNTSGAMTGGSLDKKGMGILSRNREIVEMKDKLKKLNYEMKSINNDVETAVSKIEAFERDITLGQEKIKDGELIKVRDESQLSQVEENIGRIEARIEMLFEEKKQLVRQSDETEKELKKYNIELKNIEDDIENSKKVIEQHQKKHKARESERNELYYGITDLKISLNSITESIEGINKDIKRISGEKEALLKSVNKKVLEKNMHKKEIDELEKQNELLNARINKHEQEKSGKTFEIDRIAEEKRVIEEELNEISDAINKLNKNILLLQEDYNRMEVKKTKLESEMEAVQNRLWDEYELTYTNALEYKKEIGGIQRAQKRINELRDKIKELGSVNVAAIDEYIKTKERYEFMNIQRNDMEQAKQKLHRVIGEMISIMKKQFLEQFALINKNFSIVFKELFDGGRAGLVLVDEKNVLETGIEIEVQPPGKKLQNMMLLSGGERALTAIALLFAILRLKPTPFCVLDEIEAALDDANVYRFSNYLKSFAHQTQFVIITHRKGTMEGSDILYGVTMEERGISKIVSMKMDESKAG